MLYCYIVIIHGKGVWVLDFTADNALPLYVQLTNQLRKEIENGTYRKNEKIPTELELCKKYKVSRITVRNALELLAKEHLLVRKQGLGTFVAGERFSRDISKGSSFTQICQENGQVPGGKVIKSVIESANADDIKELGLKEGDKVIVLERIRYADGVPVGFEISRFPERFSFLLNEDLNNVSLISLLSEKYNISFGRCPKVIELTFATYEISRYLEIENGYPLISISSLSCDMDGVPSHRSFQYVVGDKFSFYIK